jgi:VWFA-related protein
MIRLFHLSFCLASISLVVCAQEGKNATPQDAPRAVIRTEARLVLVDVVVRDRKTGKTATGLTAKDFHVWEDGKERPIASFSGAGDASPEVPQPRYLLFLFYNSSGSASDRVAVLSSFRQDVTDFIGAYSGPDHYVGLAAFNGTLSISQNFTAKADQAQRAALDMAHVAEGVRLRPPSSRIYGRLIRTHLPAEAVARRSDTTSATLVNVLRKTPSSTPSELSRTRWRPYAAPSLSSLSAHITRC